MKFHSFLIKYGEIGIKGKNRYIFEDALVRQIRYALQGVDGEFLVHKCHGRVYVDCDGDYDFDETVESLQKVFGIVGICPVVRVPVAELAQLRKDVVAYVDEAYEEKNMTFKVDARRAKKSYPANSMEINCEVGEAILEAFPEMKVDVHKPELRINVEIREEVYIYSRIIPGPGGMPIGTNGSAMLLLSGGIDSPVAGYMVSSVVLNSRQLISMHHRTQVKEQKRRWLILQDSFLLIQDRSSFMLSTLQIFSFISMRSVHMMN